MAVHADHTNRLGVWHHPVRDGSGDEMSERADEPAGYGAHNGLRALDGPADEELAYSGPGNGHAGDRHEGSLPSVHLPGGVDHTTVAVGAGSLGLALLGISGIFKRRRNRRRYESLDE
jgi:hypothetical protein